MTAPDAHHPCKKPGCLHLQSQHWGGEDRNSWDSLASAGQSATNLVSKKHGEEFENASLAPEHRWVLIFQAAV